MSIELFCGDCLEIMPELMQKIDLILADPPYEILNKKCTWDKMIDIDKMWQRIKLVKRDEAVPVILFSQEPYTSRLIQSNIDEFKYKWYWEKTAPVGHLNAKKQPLRCIEEILVFYEKQCNYFPIKTEGHKPVNSFRKTVCTANNTDCYGETKHEIVGGGNTDRFPKNLLTFKSDKQLCSLHPTQKPVALLEYLVKTYTKEGDTVLDFCMGSGTTGVACRNLNRNFIGIELDEKYFNIAKDRIECSFERELFND